MRAQVRCAVTYEEKVVVLWLRPQVLEDRLLPVSLHVVPVLYLAVKDGLVPIARCLGVGDGLITDEEVQVLEPTFGRDGRV